MWGRAKGRIAGWRAKFQQPAGDPATESAYNWARRKTALAVTTPAFLLVEFTATPLVGLLVSTAAGALTAFALVGATFIGSLLVAPVAQRNSLREQIVGKADEIKFTEQLESVRWEFHLPMGSHGRVFRITTQAVAWVWVTNSGPTANFAAEVRDVTGLPSDWGDYFVAEAAWDQKNSAIIEIPHGGRRKLKLASIARSPQRGFWFWTSEGQNEVPGWQWWMGDLTTGDVRFEVVLTNTATDQIATCRGRIRIPREAADTSFEVES